ncbi:hypothetical protein MLD38_011653 [Melastoma candidum]|uniref:Uncharacterized protein n=1 Tax=Melastoma candidum TaxID=119954 RepID=A0ACB9R6S2_9MYRT|nr:hypothetical protein MLD38_011653 [Melastoma candidum]
MEGWLYLIRSNRFGLQHSRKLYFVLHDHRLKSFNSVPGSSSENPVRSAIIDCCIRVIDNGRESIHGKVFFNFTLYNTTDQNDQLKLGASSPEEAARWIHSLQESAIEGEVDPGKIFISCSKSKRRSSRLDGYDWINYIRSVDRNVSESSSSDQAASDVVLPSPWTIFGCQNGLRLFKEAKNQDNVRKWDDHPAAMAVGVVDGTPESIFQEIMSLGTSRSLWDFCFDKGSVVEHIDGHTDIIHKQLRKDWLPWRMQGRDLLLKRYWRREDDGTYVILYHSVFHKECPPQKGFIRACLRGGGYVISPLNNGRHSAVKHMLAIDWKYWKSYMRPSFGRSITVRMLERVAALRELFQANMGSYPSSELSSRELENNISMISSGFQRHLTEHKSTDDPEKEFVRTPSERMSLIGLTDAADEFFDVPEPSDCDQSENECGHEYEKGILSQDACQSKFSTPAGFVKKFQSISAQKRVYLDLPEKMGDEKFICCYGTTLPEDSTAASLSSWSEADPSTFQIRGKNYLKDHQKFKTNGSLMRMIAADWLKSDKREDNLGGRRHGIVQKYAKQGGAEFFFIVHIQVPGSTTYSLALYYMMSTPLSNAPLLESFVKGDDTYRNSRFKLIPHIFKGPWIVKQSVGKKPCLIGQALTINYFRGSNFIELGVDIGSSAIARGVVSLVLGYLNNLVIEMAFLVQANTEDELPENLIGTCRLNHLDVAKAASLRP